MNMFNKRIIIFIIGLIFFITIFSNRSYAAFKKINKLDVDVELNENGDAKVTETINVGSYSTNTLSKTFEYDSSKIKDISVTNITNNKNYKQVNNMQDLAGTESFYALKNSEGLFEITWDNGKGLIYKNKTYKITYTIEGVTKLYNDCAEFYWQFLESKPQILVKNISGKIKLPDDVKDLDDFKIWVHGAPSLDINKVSNNLVEFKMVDSYDLEKFEVRIVATPEIFQGIHSKNKTDKLQEILSNEEVLVKEEEKTNELKIEKAESTKTIVGLSSIAITVIFLAIFLYFNKVMIDNPKMKPSREIKYFKEIPNKDASPADIEFIYKLGKKFDTGKVLSAILLSLGMKKYINFEQRSREKDDVNINILQDGSQPLTGEEKNVLKYLKDIASGGRTVPIRKFEKYAKAHKAATYILWTSMIRYTKKRNFERGKYDQQKVNSKTKFYVFGVLFVILALASIVFSSISKATLLVALVSIINVVSSIIIITRLHGFSQELIDEREKLNGLKNFLDHFSLLDEKDIPNLELWEKYLVYAIIFENWNEVMNSLMTKFPNLQSDKNFKDDYQLIDCFNKSNLGEKFSKTIHYGYARYISRTGVRKFGNWYDESGFASGSGR